MKMRLAKAAKAVTGSKLFVLLFLGATVLFLAGVAWA